MIPWAKEELNRIVEADDLHIAPVRAKMGPRTEPRRGSGPSRSMTLSTRAATAGKTLVGTGPPCGRRRGGSLPPE
jgi:hypothetical protein